MPHTVMGRDVHVVEALVPLGAPGVVLLTDEARARAHDEGLTGLAPADALRAGPRLDAWRARYADRALYAWRP